MENIKAINYTGFNYQCIGEERAKDNLRIMQKRTACNTVIIVLGAIQDEADSTAIDFQHAVMPKDTDLVDFIRYAKQLGLKVFLKPVIECGDGSCRADINFTADGEFQMKAWEKWFANYTSFVLHYATLAERTECEMFFIGCRLLKLTFQADDWRNLIEQVRSCYQGKLTYEADIYNESMISFWDKLDYIASSGNYSILHFRKEIDRIVKLAERYGKELLLTECGCMSTKGSASSPNTWEIDGILSLQEQVIFFERVFEQCSKQKMIKGIGIWCWNNRRQSERAASKDKRYYIYGKPVCEFIRKEWKNSVPALSVI